MTTQAIAIAIADRNRHDLATVMSSSLSYVERLRLAVVLSAERRTM